MALSLSELFMQMVYPAIAPGAFPGYLSDLEEGDME
jgi:hypothetical protein